MLATKDPKYVLGGNVYLNIWHESRFRHYRTLYLTEDGTIFKPQTPEIDELCVVVQKRRSTDNMAQEFGREHNFY